MIEAEHLRKEYPGGVLAVRDLTLTVKPGEVFAMLGANGAGKTTTLMMLLGFTEPTSGIARISGHDVLKEPLQAKKLVAYVSEDVQLYGNLSARQNLEFFARLSRKKLSDDQMMEVVRRVGLEEAAFRQRVKRFSKGMRQRLGIAIAILREAPAILLDEPTSGLDPKGGVEFLALLDTLRSEGRAIWMTTHDIFRAKEIADRVGMMVKGDLVTTLTRDEMAKEDLERLYIEYVEGADGNGES